MKKSVMKKQNWILVITGILVNYFGFYLISFITTNYDGPYAFISVLTVIIGLGILIAGLSINFAPLEEIDSEFEDS